MQTIEDYRKLLDDINALFIRYGKTICSGSVFRLTCINQDGSNHYGTTIEKEREICERLQDEQKAAKRRIQNNIGSCSV
jgi:hypothetical protein